MLNPSDANIAMAGSAAELHEEEEKGAPDEDARELTLDRIVRERCPIVTTATTATTHQFPIPRSRHPQQHQHHQHKHLHLHEHHHSNHQL